MTVQPPHDAVAEQAVLGACMHGPDVIDEIRPMLDAADFYRPQHETIWRALLALRGEDNPTDPITVSDFLTCQGDITRVGGVVYVHQLYGAPPSASHAAYYADIVRRTAALRRLREHGIRTVQRAQEPGADPDEIRSEIETDLGAERERALASGSGRLSRYLVDGWRFVTETGADKEPLWGTREKTAWASGESLMIVGAPGVGKTTLAHQVVLARIGLQGTVLDMPVAPSKRVLYLAMDRPQQIAKAMVRRIGPHDEAILRDRLVVWQGPLPTSLDREPDLLADLAAAHQADTIVIDSLKDAVSTLVDDALAVAFNNARQRAADHEPAAQRAEGRKPSSWLRATAAADRIPGVLDHGDDDAAAQAHIAAFGELMDALPFLAPTNAKAQLQQAALAFERATRSRIRAEHHHARALRSSIKRLLRDPVGRADGAGLAMLLDAAVLVVMAAARWHDIRRHEQQAAAARKTLCHLQAAYGQAVQPVLTELTRHTPRAEIVRRYEADVRRALPDHAERILADPAWPALTTTLARAETAGHQPHEVLAEAAAQRELHTAQFPAEVLTWRITNQPGKRTTTATTRRSQTSRREVSARPLPAHRQPASLDPRGPHR
ncbi:DnaB-like helicase N-terminal domain-containing protein [Streptomyces sp. NPDC002537]